MGHAARRVLTPAPTPGKRDLVWGTRVGQARGFGLFGLVFFFFVLFCLKSIRKPNANVNTLSFKQNIKENIYVLAIFTL